MNYSVRRDDVHPRCDLLRNALIDHGAPKLESFVVPQGKRNRHRRCGRGSCPACRPGQTRESGRTGRQMRSPGDGRAVVARRIAKRVVWVVRESRERLIGSQRGRLATIGAGRRGRRSAQSGGLRTRRNSLKYQRANRIMKALRHTALGRGSSFIGSMRDRTTRARQNNPEP